MSTSPPSQVSHWLSGLSTASSKVLMPAEIEGYRRAQQLAFGCAQAVASVMSPGWTEGETGQWMVDWLHNHGVRAHLHRPIVAFGPRTCAPTGQWGPARGIGATLQENDVVMLDCAPVVDGYTGDIAYTIGVGQNPELEQAQNFLSDLRQRLVQCFSNAETVNDVYAWVDREITAAGYENAADGYPGEVLGHRVYRHGPLTSRISWFLPEKPFGPVASWHGPGFLFKLIRRMIEPELLTPSHHGSKTGIWAIEPHLRAGSFGCKFEELLVVEPGRAFWLDDMSQKRITIA
ncbi:M24 family metallopeptidase [Paraburkholderia acidicola]